MSQTWRVLREWPELVLERLEGAGVARIILNRPDKRNCLNAPLVTAFFEALDIVRSDRDLKVVITKGAGAVYSSGSTSIFCVRSMPARRGIGTSRRRRFGWPRRCASFRA